MVLCYCSEYIPLYVSPYKSSRKGTDVLLLKLLVLGTENLNNRILVLNILAYEVFEISQP